jgi:hypothetical protein
MSIVTMLIWATRHLVNFWNASRLDLFATIIINGAYDILLIALWAYSSVLQSSGDFTDTQHISIRQWYLDRGCEKGSGGDLGACEIVVAAYGLSVLLTCMI